MTFVRGAYQAYTSHQDLTPHSVCHDVRQVPSRGDQTGHTRLRGAMTYGVYRAWEVKTLNHTMRMTSWRHEVGPWHRGCSGGNLLDLATSTCDSMNQTFPDDAPTTATHLHCNLPLIRRTRLVPHWPLYKIRISWWHVRMAIRCQTSTIFCVGKGD